jgi:hypothetical protein
MAIPKYLRLSFSMQDALPILWGGQRAETRNPFTTWHFLFLPDRTAPFLLFVSNQR